MARGDWASRCQLSVFLLSYVIENPLRESCRYPAIEVVPLGRTELFCRQLSCPSSLKTQSPHYWVAMHPHCSQRPCHIPEMSLKQCVIPGSLSQRKIERHSDHWNPCCSSEHAPLGCWAQQSGSPPEARWSPAYLNSSACCAQSTDRVLTTHLNVNSKLLLNPIYCTF